MSVYNSVSLTSEISCRTQFFEMKSRKPRGGKKKEILSSFSKKRQTPTQKIIIIIKELYEETNKL